LVLLLAILLMHLAFGDNPWQDGIAKRIRENNPVRSIDYAVTYGWWMAALNAVAVAGLLLTRRRWLVRRPIHDNPDFAPPERRDLRWFVPLVAGAVIVAGILAAPRLSHSLWGDEEWTVRRAIDGTYVRDASGRIDFQSVQWRDTFFDYRKPSNHVGYCVPARLCLATWRILTRPDLHFVNETAVRLPAYFAGLAAVAAVAFLLRRLGFALPGVFAAWLLALHPWHLRYTSEARGYALLVLLVPVAMLALLRALQRGTWGRWAIYGAAQFWMMWTWPLAGFPVAVLNLAAVGALWHTTRGRPDARIQWTRWALVCGVGALLWLQLMLGNLIQLTQYLERESLRLGGSWLVEFGSHLVAGVGWRDRPVYHDLVEVARAWPGIFWSWLAISATLVLLGAVRLLAGGVVRALLCLVLVLPGGLLFLWAYQQGTFLNQWYLLFTLPCVVVLLAVGFDLAVQALAPSRSAAALSAAAMLVWLALFGALTGPARSALRAGSLQPMRESVELTRPTLDPFTPENERILTASIQRPPDYYDPRVVLVEDPGELRALMQRADASGMPLFVNFGRPGLARKRVPQLLALVEREDLFEEIAVLHGFEPRGARYVYRYRGRRASTDTAP
jgi:hypothetical protein